MNYAAEFPVAQMVADYLKAVSDHAIQKLCPVVTFFDPMSIDDAHRLTVMVPNVETSPDAPGNFTAHVECGHKSQWKQKTLQQDFDNHVARVSEYRLRIMVRNLMAQLEAYCPVEIGLEFVQPRRQFHTNVFKEGWIYSESAFVIQGFFKAPTEN